MMHFAAVLLALFTFLWFFPLLRFCLHGWNTAVDAIDDNLPGFLSRDERTLVVIRCIVLVVFFVALYAGLVTLTWHVFSLAIA